MGSNSNSTSDNYQTFVVNNSTIAGNYNTVVGNGNIITGSYNKVVGNGTIVTGNYNGVTGSGTIVSGNYNKINGTGTKITGRYNEATGSGIIDNGSYTKVNGESSSGIAIQQNRSANKNVNQNKQQGKNENPNKIKKSNKMKSSSKMKSTMKINTGSTVAQYNIKNSTGSAIGYGATISNNTAVSNNANISTSPNSYGGANFTFKGRVNNNGGHIGNSISKSSRVGSVSVGQGIGSLNGARMSMSFGTRNNYELGNQKSVLFNTGFINSVSGRTNSSGKEVITMVGVGDDTKLNIWLNKNAVHEIQLTKSVLYQVLIFENRKLKAEGDRVLLEFGDNVDRVIFEDEKIYDCVGKLLFDSNSSSPTENYETIEKGEDEIVIEEIQSS